MKALEDLRNTGLPDLVLGAALLSFVVLVLVFIVAAATADAKITFCWPSRQSSGDVYLVGNRYYRPNIVLGKFDSFEAAVKAAELIKCPIEIEQ